MLRRHSCASILQAIVEGAGPANGASLSLESSISAPCDRRQVWKQNVLISSTGPDMILVSSASDIAPFFHFTSTAPTVCSAAWRLRNRARSRTLRTQIPHSPRLLLSLFHQRCPTIRTPLNLEHPYVRHYTSICLLIADMHRYHSAIPRVGDHALCEHTLGRSMHCGTGAQCMSGLGELQDPRPHRWA